MGHASAPDAQRPHVVVGICHHAGLLLQRCLQSVLTSEGVDYEVYVVSSADSATWETVRAPYQGEPRITWWWEAGGPAHKRNVVAARTRAPYLIFLDDDVEISPYTLYELVTWTQQRPTCGMAFARIYLMGEGKRQILDDCGSWLTWTGFLWSRAQNNQQDVGQYEQPTRCLASKSATCIVRREAFRAAGGFDADYYILGEETDLAWRMWLQGWEVWYVPTAKSWHAFGCEELKPKQAFYTEERIFYRGVTNYLSLLLSNLGALRLWLILPGHLLAWGVAAVGFTVRGQRRRSRLILLGLWDGLIRRRTATWRKRRQVQATRCLSDRALLRCVFYAPPVSYFLKRLLRYVTQGYHG